MSLDSLNPRSADDLDRALGHAIKLRRRSLNMTQDELAQACGVSFQQIQKYESGANRISFSRLTQIARALRCSVNDLTSAFAQPEAAAADFEILQLMTESGAVDLLKRYGALSPVSRKLLLAFLTSLSAGAL